MRKLYIALCGGIVLTGCSSFSEQHQASGNVEYLKEETHKKIIVPESFTPLKSNTEFSIPSIGDDANVNLVGKKLDIRAPSLIMPVAPNTLTSDNSKKTQVVFESFLSQEKFREQLWDHLNTFIEEKTYGVGIEVEGQSLSTRSIESDEYFKLLFGLDDESLLSQQYKFDIDVDAQGHRAIVTVNLIDHQEQNKPVELNRFAKRRYETRMLNLFLSQVNAKHNQVLIDTYVESRKGIKLELSFDNAQNTVYKVHAPFEVVWEKLSIVLPRLGLNIYDRDKSVNTYFTIFDEDVGGFWSNLFSFGGGDHDIELEQNSKYQIKLDKSGNVSLLTVIDAEGQLVPVDKMTEMLNSFSKAMAKKEI